MKKFLINVNGNEYEVEVEEIANGESTTERPAQASQPKPASRPAAKSKPAPKKAAPKKEVVVSEGSESIDAPMPGSILSINVKEGDTVKSGQVLLILEAMKMENEILAPRDGKVASISISEGTSVNTGDNLVVIE